jgi:cytidylate kinase
MPVVTIARQLGSLGDEIARAVADCLELRLVDQAMVDEVAAQLGLSSGAVPDDEQNSGLVGDLVRTMRRLYPATVTPPNEVDMETDEAASLQVMRQVAWEIARAGDAVIVGRGGAFLLERNPSVLHVLVLAPMPIRAERVMASEHLDAGRAARRVRESDAQRARYVRRFYGQNWLDPSMYDFVINTGHFSEPAATDLIVRAVKGDAPDTPGIS